MVGATVRERGVSEMSAIEGSARARPLANAWPAKRIRRLLVQLAIVGTVAASLAWLGVAVRDALASKGVAFSFAYLSGTAGISLSEGSTVSLAGFWPTLSDFVPDDTNAQALVTGLFNTLKVAAAAIILSTAFGTAVGVGRLSSNWLVRNLSFGLVEFVRNTPLLIQLVFWYFAVVLKFPPASAGASLFGVVLASRSGVFLPGLVASEAATTASSVSLFVAGFCAVAALIARRKPLRLSAAAIAVACLFVAFATGFPLQPDVPIATRFGARGGTTLTPEMTALLLAITVNSSAYVAEIVRGAIDALPRGQWEAAAALGLSRGQQLRDIVLPQVFRVVLPSLGNRYISLVKDTSLGIAIGYPDLFNVYGTIANQTGRNLEGVIIVMLTYLVLSWAISGAVNLANRRITRPEGGR